MGPCRHGANPRQCYTCELEEQIVELESRLHKKEQVMKCQTCRFFDAYSLREGNCRRFPPVPVKFLNAETERKEPVGVFPSVTYEDWCGEYKERA